MASRRRSYSGGTSPHRGAARERSRSPRSGHHSQSPLSHRGREDGGHTAERSRHHTSRVRDEWMGTASRHGEQNGGKRGQEGSCSYRSDRGGDSRGDRGSDSKHDRGGDSRHDRGGDSRHDRGGDSRNDRKGDSRHDRVGDSRHDRGGDRRRDRSHDRGGDSRHDKDDSRGDRGDDHNSDRRGVSRSDRGDDRRRDRRHDRGGNRHDRGDDRADRAGDKKPDRGGDRGIDNMHEGGDVKHDNPEGPGRRAHRWSDSGAGEQGGTATAQHEFGGSSHPAGRAAGKEEPNFALSGSLTADTNTYKGVVIAYSEPEEARIPKIRWRLYPFKGEEALPVLYIHRQSAYLIGRDRQIADIPVDHPSCSKQHCVLQYRLVERPKEDGGVKRVIRPYLIDLQSTNGTYINNQRIDPARYVELKEKDVVKFGFSSREYVLLHEHSVAAQPSPGQEEAAAGSAGTEQ